MTNNPDSANSSRPGIGGECKIQKVHFAKTVIALGHYGVGVCRRVSYGGMKRFQVALIDSKLHFEHARFMSAITV